MMLVVTASTFRADPALFGQYVHRADGHTDAIRIGWNLHLPEWHSYWWVWL